MNESASPTPNLDKYFNEEKIFERKEDNSPINKEEENFSKINILVGKITSCEVHPNAEKMYLEAIDIGEETPRQIISGLVDQIPKENMLNSNVLVVTNLKRFIFNSKTE